MTRDTADTMCGTPAFHFFSRFSVLSFPSLPFSLLGLISLGSLSPVPYAFVMFSFLSPQTSRLPRHAVRRLVLCGLRHDLHQDAVFRAKARTLQLGKTDLPNKHLLTRKSKRAARPSYFTAHNPAPKPRGKRAAQTPSPCHSSAPTSETAGQECLSNVAHSQTNTL